MPIPLPLSSMHLACRPAEASFLLTSAALVSFIVSASSLLVATCLVCLPDLSFLWYPPAMMMWSTQLFRNKAWNHVLNTCTIVHLILPMIEIQRCLPCIHMEYLPHDPDANALFIGNFFGPMLSCRACPIDLSVG